MEVKATDQDIKAEEKVQAKKPEEETRKKLKPRGQDDEDEDNSYRADGLLQPVLNPCRTMPPPSQSLPKTRLALSHKRNSLPSQHISAFTRVEPTKRPSAMQSLPEPTAKRVCGLEAKQGHLDSGLPTISKDRTSGNQECLVFKPLQLTNIDTNFSKDAWLTRRRTASIGGNESGDNGKVIVLEAKGDTTAVATNAAQKLMTAANNAMLRIPHPRSSRASAKSKIPLSKPSAAAGRPSDAATVMHAPKDSDPSLHWTTAETMATEPKTPKALGNMTNSPRKGLTGSLMMPKPYLPTKNPPSQQVTERASPHEKHPEILPCAGNYGQTL